jgi:hypothetical protein
MGEKRNAYRLLVGMSEGKRPLGRPSRWPDNIRMDLVEVGWCDVEWIGIEPSGSIKCWETIECTNNYGSLE